MTQNRVSGYRTRRFGAALTAVAMVSIGMPSVAHADPLSDSSTTDAGASVEGSVAERVGVGHGGYSDACIFRTC